MTLQHYSPKHATEQEAFEHWFARNHPWDWFAKDRGGEPLGVGDRLRIWSLCHAAYFHDERLQNCASGGPT